MIEISKVSSVTAIANTEENTGAVIAPSLNELEDEDFERVRKMKEITDIYVKRNFTLKIDYGTIPGCGDKKTLFKPGAEKLKELFGLIPHFEIIDSIVDFKEKLFYFHYRCKLYRDNQFMGECDAIAVSLERKFKSQIDKGNYGAINNVVKMAQKRSFVGSILLVCNMSQYFTQDLEDTDEVFNNGNGNNKGNYYNNNNGNSNGSYQSNKGSYQNNNGSSNNGASFPKGEITKEEFERKFRNN